MHHDSVRTSPSTEFRFTSADGLRIACARWNCRGPERGVVQIAHGMGEHMGRYGEAVDALVAAGFTVYANDHRGHGLTAAFTERFADFGAGGFGALVGDMVRLSRIAQAECPDAPFFLLGHGMGSFAAQQYALDHSHNLDGLILSGSGDLDALAALALSARGQGNVLSAAFQPAPTPFEWLSRDPAVVRAVAADPLCFAELRPAAFASLLAAAPRLSDLGELRAIRHGLPVYLLSGEMDPVGQRLAGVRTLIARYRSAGLYRVAHRFYGGGRHEMLNEINRREVMADLLAWMGEVLPLPPRALRLASVK